MNFRRDDSGDASVRASLITQPPPPIGCGLAGGSLRLILKDRINSQMCKGAQGGPTFFPTLFVTSPDTIRHDPQPLRAQFEPFQKLSDLPKSGRERIALEHCCASGVGRCGRRRRKCKPTSRLDSGRKIYAAIWKEKGGDIAPRRPRATCSGVRRSDNAPEHALFLVRSKPDVARAGTWPGDRDGRPTRCPPQLSRLAASSFERHPSRARGAFRCLTDFSGR